MNPAIETHDLVKQYRQLTAVNHLSLHVDTGEIYAFLGLNGAGKTTTIRMLLGMVRPTSGEARLLGESIRLGGFKPWKDVGYLVESPHAYPELSVRENLEAIRRLRPGLAVHMVNEVIERLGLGEYADRKAGKLSHGNQQRLGLAKALLHRPKLLLLDEPANGLDPAGIVEIRLLLRELVREEGTTVFMSSHILGEVARLADRIGIIHQGRLVQQLDVEELERNRKRRLLIRTRNPESALAILQREGYRGSMADGTIELEDGRAISSPDAIANLLVNGNHPPLMLFVEQEELEAYFLRLIGVNRERFA